MRKEGDVVHGGKLGVDVGLIRVDINARTVKLTRELVPNANLMEIFMNSLFRFREPQ